MTEFHIIEDKAGLDALDAYLEESGDVPLAFDFETTGLDYFVKDVGISFSVDEKIGFYVVTREFNRAARQLIDAPIRKELKPFLEKWLVKRKQRILIAHNAIFDTRVLLVNYGLRAIENILACTRILFKLAISEDDPAGLKDLGVRYLGADAKDEQEDLKASVIANGGRWLRYEKDIYMGAKEILAKYGAKDACLTLALYEHLIPTLKADAQLWDLWNIEVLPLQSVVFDMNTTGFAVDVPYFENLKIEMTNDINNLEKEILNDIHPLVGDYERQLIHKKTKIGHSAYAKRLAKDAGLDWKNLTEDQEFYLKEEVHRQNGSPILFQLTSNKDLTWLIYEKLKEPVTKKTEKGSPSVDGGVIESLANKYTWANKLLQKKSLEKLLSTYVECVLNEHVNGLVYFDYDQCGTISGRFSTRGGVPIMTLPKGDLRIKRGFIAPKGYKLCAADANSLEPHLAAYLSKDPKLIDSFVQGKDFYSVIGIEQFGKHDSTPFKDGSPNSFAKKYSNLRDLVKTYSLASLYGAEDYRISEVIHPEAMSWEERKKARKEASDLLNGYFKAFPGIERLITSSHMEAHLNGAIRTKFGRIRHMPLVKEVYKQYGTKLQDARFAKANGLQDLRRKYKNYLNNSVNIQIQGLGSHVINLAMINISKEFKKLNLDARICIQVHDEIICVAKESCAEQVLEIMKKCISTAIDLNPITIKSEGKIGNNLGETK